MGTQLRSVTQPNYFRSGKNNTGAAIPPYYVLMQGTSGSVIPVKQTREYEGTAREGGKPVETAYFDGGGRMASAPSETRPEAIQRAVAFLRKHLG